ncbi:hypothetical protein [Glycomyces halotolerans]
MQITEFGAADPELIAESYELLAAAHAADTPENPAPVRRFFETTFTLPRPGRSRRSAAGDDYELRQWTGPIPADLLATMCRMESMIVSEIPLGDLDVEAEEVDTEKMRAMERVNEAEGRIRVDSVAVDRATGEVVAWSEITVDDGPYRDAHQGITIVAPGHRGHRLGLLVKLANLRQLREHFDRVEAIWTDNADVNSHMIAINEQLGYETVDASADYHRKLES